MQEAKTKNYYIGKKQKIIDFSIGCFGPGILASIITMPLYIVLLFSQSIIDYQYGNTHIAEISLFISLIISGGLAVWAVYIKRKYIFFGFLLVFTFSLLKIGIVYVMTHSGGFI